jgi:hypothetical protein
MMLTRRLRFALIAPLIAGAWLMWGCGGSEVIGSLGGSEVVAKLVTQDSLPVSGADVQVLDITRITDSAGNISFDTAVVATAISDKDGQVKFEALDQIEFYLYATFKKDSLILPPVRFTSDSTKQVNLGVLVMKAPGAISGTVVRDSLAPDALIHCSIVGTSYGATANSKTPDFIISTIIPDTTYEVTISSDHYTSVTIPGVAVKPGETTKLPEIIRLELDTNLDLEIAPTGLSVSFDTLTGKAHLTWQGVPYKDVKQYIVFSSTDSGRTWNMDTVDGTLMIMNVFSDVDDSLLTVWFQVAAFDNANNQGPKGDIAALGDVPSPSSLRVNMTFAKVDGISTADSAVVAMTFNSRIRLVTRISWWADNPDSIIKTRSITGTKTGSDTIIWATATSKKQLYVTLTDNAGATWTDSIDATTLRPIKTWLLLDSLRYERRYAGACAVGGKIYVFGGCREKRSATGFSPANLKTAEMYDPESGQWDSIAPMNRARYRAAYAVVDGKIYVFGGAGDASIERYDPANDKWEVLADSMPKRLSGASACAINGVIYLIGGNAGTSDDPVLLKTIATYDPVKHLWGKAGELQTARELHQSVVINTTIITLGGQRYDEATGENFALDDFECFSPSGDNACGLTRTLGSARFGFGAAVVKDKLVLIGGLSAADVTAQPMSTVEIFTLATWTAGMSGRNMPAAREGIAVATLNDCIYVIGGSESGQGDQKSTGAVYVYYP